MQSGKVTVITQTRYGGIYEGGPWAAFATTDLAFDPGDAFSGDTFALAWWDTPTVPVGVGETPDQALARPQKLIERDRNQAEEGLFAPGDPVLVARCAPDEWKCAEAAIVVSVEWRPCRPFVGGLRGQGLYTVRCGERELTVPERYLRDG